MIIAHKHTTIIKVAALLVVATLVVVVGWLSLQSTSRAADLSKFDPGNIMSDAVMSNKVSMSVQQIQNFLNSKNACNNTNTHMAAWYPHLQYTIRDGKFVCMAQDTFNGESAAQIIWQAAQDYSINPQVLIVLLEKEQGLISDTWPNHVQYRTATGFGCPDTAPCESQYFGLKNQIRLAASMFRAVLNGGWSNYPVGQTYVQYHPNAACGGTTVSIQNRATSALYRYTPYQPNRAALNAGYGKGDDCSAYGNRNFYALFTDWFGSTQVNPSFISFDKHTWLRIKSTTSKVNLATGQRMPDSSLAAGRDIKYADKILLNGVWYIRTAHDQLLGNYQGIPESELIDIPYEDLESPRWFILENDGNKSVPKTRSYHEFLRAGTALKVVQKISIDGATYYRTEHDKNISNNLGIIDRQLSDFKFLDFEVPTVMILQEDSVMSDVLTGQSGDYVPSGTVHHLSKKIIINGQWYYQTSNNAGKNGLAILAKNYNRPVLTQFSGTRTIQLQSPAPKIDLHTLVPMNQPKVPTGSNVEVMGSIEIGGVLYYRTQHDQSIGNNQGLVVNDLLINLGDSEKKEFTVTKSVAKLRLNTQSNHDHILQPGQKIQFSQKMRINNSWCYRTAHDTQIGNMLCVPGNYLN